MIIITIVIISTLFHISFSFIPTVLTLANILSSLSRLTAIGDALRKYIQTFTADLIQHTYMRDLLQRQSLPSSAIGFELPIPSVPSSQAQAQSQSQSQSQSTTAMTTTATIAASSASVSSPSTVPLTGIRNHTPPPLNLSSISSSFIPPSVPSDSIATTSKNNHHTNNNNSNHFSSHFSPGRSNPYGTPPLKPARSPMQLPGSPLKGMVLEETEEQGIDVCVLCSFLGDLESPLFVRSAEEILSK